MLRAGLEITGSESDVLSTEALALVARLERELGATRDRILAARAERQARLDAGEMPDFPAATASIRDGHWRVAPPPRDLEDRRVEITGPTDRKMMINALNSGASVFMADFEDSLSPTWENVVVGQKNLTDAIDGTISHDEKGKSYKLNDRVAVLMVRPRGWHLSEKHVKLGSRPVSASFFDFGLHVARNARKLVEKGSGVYLYLPKLEGRHEAALWRDAFVLAEDALGLGRGTIRATVLVETLPGAFEMDEILHELRDHSAGLNAGRWDYLFSLIKRLRAHPDFVLPDRSQLVMTVPFLRAYTELLVKTCHRRGAHAIGGMSAFIPSRKDAKVNEVALAKVREDKLREAGDGFDGTWVAHPDLVPVAREPFDAQLRGRKNQLDRTREDVKVEAADLLRLSVRGGAISEAGLRNNVAVAVRYLESWLRGTGAVAINNLMEDAATAEISRSQVWQWIRHRARLDGGDSIDRELAARVLREETAKIERVPGSRLDEAAALFERVALDQDLPEFLTLPAYDRLS